MIRTRTVQIVAGLAVMAAVSGCADSSQPLEPLDVQYSASAGGLQTTGRTVILGRGSKLPSDLASLVEKAGGRLTSELPEIGVAFAESRDPAFRTRLERISSIESAVPDVLLEWTPPVRVRGDATLDAGDVATEGAPLVANDPLFVGLQWAPQAIQAPEAWALGYTGQGVRVAILDGAVHNAHVDLQANLDVAASRSFVPGFAYNEDTGTFWHGTHVAGIVAASANGVGTVGIAPNATLIGVKVLHNNSGAFEWVLNGIIYAARPLAQGGAGAHVMNLSLGATIPYRDAWGDKAFRDAFRELAKAHDRATRYAWQQGVTVIASAGNGGTNFDEAKNLYKLPAEAQHVISVSATGPHGWALGATDFERPAYYTDFGKSLVEVAAPGGTIGLWLVDGVDQLCVVAGILNFCEVFDMVLSTSRGGPASVTSYSWAQGTSMAAPAAAGVAALIIERSGGTASPAQVRAKLRQSSIDLGKPGQDEYYGHGWVNALRAVQ